MPAFFLRVGMAKMRLPWLMLIWGENSINRLSPLLMLTSLSISLTDALGAREMQDQCQPRRYNAHETPLHACIVN